MGFVALSTIRTGTLLRSWDDWAADSISISWSQIRQIWKSCTARPEPIRKHSRHLGCGPLSLTNNSHNEGNRMRACRALPAHREALLPTTWAARCDQPRLQDPAQGPPAFARRAAASAPGRGQHLHAPGSSPLQEPQLHAGHHLLHLRPQEPIPQLRRGVEQQLLELPEGCAGPCAWEEEWEKQRDAVSRRCKYM